MQNDLCHSEGIYARNGLIPSNIPTILPYIVNVAGFCKKQKIPVIATMLSIITDLQGEACGLGSARKLRPFLQKEGFRPNTWGHGLLEEITTTDYQIKQWGMSPFHQTELARLLEALGIDSLILTGFTTNGTVESCAREGISRHFRVVTLTNCVASYSESLHQGSLINLGAFGQIMSAEEWMQQSSPSEPS